MKSSDRSSSRSIARTFKSRDRCTQFVIAWDLLGELLLLSVDPGRIDGGRALNNPNPAARRIGFSLLHLSLLSSAPHGFRFDDNDRAAGRIILLLGLQLFNPRVGTATRWEWRTIRSFLWSNRPRDASHFGVQGHRLAGDGLFAR